MNDSAKLEITWTPATCDGLPPLGTEVKVDMTNNAVYNMGLPSRSGGEYWQRGTIESYANPTDEPPLGLRGNGPFVYVKFPNLVAIGTWCALSDCVLLEIEKQPEGWPHHDPTAKLSLERDVRQRYNIDEETFAHMLRTWLKDRGYLKR